MANWLKEELAEAEKIVARSIATAGQEINKNIQTVGKELAEQRTLTKEELEKLITFAAGTFASVLDERIDKAKKEAAMLITEKLTEIRNEMSETATIQKQSAVRNTAIAIFSAVAVAIISLLYKKSLGNNLDIYVTFRSVLIAIVAGHAIWLISKYISNYLNASKLKKDAAFYAAQFLGLFRIKGLVGHLFVILLMAATWAYLTFAIN